MSKQERDWLRRKHKFIGVTISLRDDLVARIERLQDADVFPYSSRSAVYATLLAIGLKEFENTQAKKESTERQ
jgi:metal-responsive CopG/Arc/MetJ family transcriptional regulator